jgi:hypothetical protein
MIQFTKLTEEQQAELFASHSLYIELVANYLAEVSASLKEIDEQ